MEGIDDGPMRTMVNWEEEPGDKSSSRNWISGSWGQVRESGKSKVKPMYSPRRILSSKFFFSGQWRPIGMAVPGLHG